MAGHLAEISYIMISWMDFIKLKDGWYPVIITGMSFSMTNNLCKGLCDLRKNKILDVVLDTKGTLLTD